MEDEFQIAAWSIEDHDAYTRGWKALDIEWVSISFMGKQLAIDEHFGFSGTQKRDIVYTLSIPPDVMGSNFVIKAKMKGDNGTDSYGKVLMKVE